MKAKQLEKALNRAGEEAEQYANSGQTAFVISLNYLNVCGGFLGSFKADIPQFMDIAHKYLVNLGLNVHGVSRDEWQYTVHYECSVPAPTEATKTCPMCAETIKEAAVICRFCGQPVG
jgi:hypothetical protein